MIKSINIKNFRGFKDISIDSLDCVNLIIGKNNVGKTALLEAVFLLYGSHNAQIPTQLNGFRGVDTVTLEGEEVWGWLFHNRDMKNPISLEINDEENIKHKLSISQESSVTELSSKNEINLALQQTTISTTETDNKILKLNYSNSKNQFSEAIAKILSNKIEFTSSAYVPFPTSYFLSPFFRMSMAELSNLFSKLEIDGRHEEIINILKILEPRLKRLTVSYAGGIPNIMADFGKKPLLPLTYMGEGINRLLSVLVAIGTAQAKGCVLIDELENGLHYSIMLKIWQAIGALAKKRDVQIIVTTHSFECAKAAHQAYSEKREYSFRLYRLERSDDEISVVKYDKEDLETSFELGWEIR